MNRKVLLGVSIAALATATTAWAGYKGYYPVNVNTTSREAYGALGDARASADATQYIGCAVTGYGVTGVSLACYAQDAAGNYGSCSTTDSGLITAATGLTANAFVDFVWDSTGKCTYLRVFTGSQYRPVQ